MCGRIYKIEKRNENPELQYTQSEEFKRISENEFLHSELFRFLVEFTPNISSNFAPEGMIDIIRKMFIDYNFSESVYDKVMIICQRMLNELQYQDLIHKVTLLNEYKEFRQNQRINEINEDFK